VSRGLVELETEVGALPLKLAKSTAETVQPRPQTGRSENASSVMVPVLLTYGRERDLRSPPSPWRDVVFPPWRRRDARIVASAFGGSLFLDHERCTVKPLSWYLGPHPLPVNDAHVADSPPAKVELIVHVGDVVHAGCPIGRRFDELSWLAEIPWPRLLLGCSAA
jgi:hypothetical protein